MPDELHCSWCKKPQSAVDVLLSASPELNICGECLECLVGILVEKRPAWGVRVVEMITKGQKVQSQP
jgi:hypothetical protein